MLPTQIMQEFGESFVHRRVIGAATGFFSGGFPGAIAGAISAGGAPGSTATQAMLPAPVVTSRQVPAPSGVPCGAGMARDATGRCVRVSAFPVTPVLPGTTTGTTTTAAVAPMAADMFGVAVMGRFGAALEPAAMAATRLRCPRGTVLGMDDLCYNRRDLKKSERKWPPGTRPVLTGGQVNTLKRAQRIQERMKKLGLLGGVPHSHKKKAKKLLR